MDGRRLHRWIRFGALACTLCMLAAFGTASASAATLPPQGIFENCNLDTEMQTCVQRLEVMHQGGMEVVVIQAWGYSLASLSQYAEAAHSLGMSVMWQIAGPGPFWWQGSSSSTSMSGPFSALASSCGCDQNGPLLAYTVQWLSQLPGTYGYFAADAYDDTVSSGDDSGMSSYVAQIKQQDPTHTVMIGSADESETSQYQRIPDEIGTEMYPVTTSSLMPVGANQDMWGSIAQWASDAQRSADAAGKQSAFILQAFTWGDNLVDGQAIGVCSATDTQSSCYAKLRYPSSAEQLQLRNEVLSNAHPALILWFSFYGTYGQAGDDTYSIYPTGAEAAARWAGLAAAVQGPFPGAPTETHGRPHVASGHKILAHIAGSHAKRHRRRKHRRHRRRLKHRRKKRA